VVFVDWVAPPLAGVLLAGALLFAQRARKLHAVERAAAQVLAERLAGTERRQAIWVVAAAIAHDVKNPLHNLALLVEELSDETDPAAREELMQRVRENVRRAGVVELFVEDDGRGIPEELQPRLFSPFFSGGNGTGLGLVIARALVQAAGGDLTCASSAPGRTKFRFTFRPA